MEKFLSNPLLGDAKLEKSMRKNYISGFVSSIFILIASFIVGWIPPQGMWGSQLLLDLRLNYPIITIALAMIVVGTVGLMRAWLYVAHDLRNWGPGSLAAVKKGIYIWALPLVFTFPMFSRDMYAYIAQGRLAQSGLNPYSTGASSIPGWLYIGADPTWSESRTPYGPLWIFMAEIIVRITGERPEIAIPLLRILAVAGVVMIVHFLPKAAELNGHRPAKALWFAAMSPLFLLQFIVSGHNDSLMMGFLIAGVYFMLIDKPVKGLLLLALSISVKPITIIAIPFFGLIWAKGHVGWLERIKYWTMSLIISMAPVALLGAVLGWGMGWLSAFSTPGQSQNWYAPVVIIGAVLSVLFGGDIQTSIDIVKNIVLLIGLVICAYLVLGAHHIKVLRKMLYVFAVVVLISTVVYPWYALWVLILWGMTGVRNKRRMQTFILIVGFFLTYALLDTFDISVLIQGRAILQVIMFGMTIAGLGYFMYFDSTSKMFFQRGGYQYETQPGTIAGLRKIN
ncbi:MAG: polyprenol phosphomannose-dependent alpha 1,6 mannosyltransferase MptB [Micrococcaceae bacterium]